MKKIKVCEKCYFEGRSYRREGYWYCRMKSVCIREYIPNGKHEWSGLDGWHERTKFKIKWVQIGWFCPRCGHFISIKKYKNINVEDLNKSITFEDIKEQGLKFHEIEFFEDKYEIV